MKANHLPRFFLQFVLVLTWLATSALHAAEPSPALEARLQTWLASKPGCVALALIDRDGVTFAQAGQLSPDNAASPTADTVFEVGSVTKVFTGILLAETERAGKISRDDPAAKFLLPAGDPAFPGLSKITLLTLATHAAGLPRLPANFATASAPDPYTGYNRDALIAAFRVHGPFARTPAPQSYSNFGMALLGQSLAGAWDTSYADALSQKVLVPLGLHHTTLALTGSATPPELAPALTNGQPSSHWTFDSMAPTGALRSSTRELALFLQACLGFRDTPLAPALAESFKPLRPSADFPGQIGMGWFITADPQRPIVWHNGGTGGFSSFVGFCPATGQAVALLTNAPRDVTALGFELLGAAKNPLAPDRAASNPAAVRNAADFTGSYSFSPQITLLITERKGALSAQLTAQPALPLLPAGTDRFANTSVAAEISFERDADSRVIALVLHQNGRDQRAPRTPEITLTPGQLIEYAGQYALTEKITNTITADGNQLYAQLTGQPRFPLYASAPDSFFLKVVNARLTFERDPAHQIIAVVLHQNGRDSRMSKMPAAQ